MGTLWTIADISRVYGRTHSVVRRWVQEPAHGFPAPDFVTLRGTPLWWPATVRAWVAEYRPILVERQ